MSSGLLLSVIVPAYNVSEWLPRCLDSILAQTYRNIEVIVIDDGSSDDTPEIIDNYASKDKRVVAVHQENRGLVETRERGIQEARGEYIGFVDGDDEIIPEMYEKLIRNALHHNAQISQCGILYCFYDGRRKPVNGTGNLLVFNHDKGCKALLKGDEMEPSLCNKIYHSSIIQNSCLDTSIVNNEDMLRNIVLFNRAECSVMEEFCGYLYWRRGNSMSNNKQSVANGRNIIRARKMIFDYVPDGFKEDAQVNYIHGAFSVYNSLLGTRTEEAEVLRKECKNILKSIDTIRQPIPQFLRIKAFTIIHTPYLYDIGQRMNNLLRKYRIKLQAKRLKDSYTGAQ